MAIKRTAAAQRPLPRPRRPKLGRAPSLEPSPEPAPPSDDPFADPVVEQITGDILQHHGAANRNAVTVRAEVGRLLLDVREELPHGSFRAYLQKKVPFTPKTAERAVNLHRFKQKQPALFDKLAPVGVSKAYVLIGLPESTIEQLVANTHTSPTTGANKALLAMTFSEFMGVVTGGPNDSDTDKPLVKDYRRASRRLVRALDALVDQHHTIDPDDIDEIDDIYEELRLTLSRFATTFELTRK